MAQKFSIVVLGTWSMLGAVVVFDRHRAGHTVRAIDCARFDAAVDPIKHLT